MNSGAINAAIDYKSTSITCEEFDTDYKLNLFPVSLYGISELLGLSIGFNPSSPP